MNEIYTIDDILLALDMCKKFEVDIKTPPEIDGMLDTTIISIEVKMFLHNLKLLNNKSDINFVTVFEKTPPSNQELLVEDPNGTFHLTQWRESYNIFTCQVKSDNSNDWKWKLIK